MDNTSTKQQLTFKRLFPHRGQLWAAFLLPMALFLLLCLALGVAPFGENNLFIRDMRGQYVDFFSYYKTILSGENNFLYTFSKVLGGDMVGFTAYYLLSPFNLIFLLFDNAEFSLAVTLLMALKLGACGLTAAIFLRATGKRHGMLLLFSTAYALMSYNIVYACNIIWLDGVIALPLVALGIHRLLEEKRIWLYVLALAYALITNYYIGYMLCIFSVLYFLMRFVLGLGRWDRTASLSLLRFAGASLLVGALCAVVLVPTVFSLEGTKASFAPELLTFTQNFSLSELTDRLFFGSIEYMDTMSISTSEAFSAGVSAAEETGMPNLFCGIVTLLCALLFFANRRIYVRERLLGGVLLLLLLLSLWIKAFDLVWHGFNEPVHFPYRYAFLISFTSIALAWRCVQESEGIVGRAWGIAAAVALCLAALLVSLGGVRSMDTASFIGNALCLAFSGLGLWLLLREKVRRYGLLLLAAVQLFSLLANSLSIKELRLQNVEQYSGYIQRTEPLVDYIKENDDGFYRVEKTYLRSANDSMQFAYNGLTHFSSTGQVFARQLHLDLGYYAENFVQYYANGSTMSMDSLLGVKYILTGSRSYIRPYEPFVASEDVAAFCNPYALPLCMAVDADSLTALPDEASAFRRQNDMFRAASGVQEDIFAPIGGVEMEGDNLNILQLENILRLDKIDAEQEGVLTIRFAAPSENLLYARFLTPTLKEVSIESDGQSADKAGVYCGEIFCLGAYAEGETVELRLRLSDASLTLTAWELFEESESVLAAHIEALRPAAEESLQRQSSSHLVWHGLVDEGQGALLLSVPYESEWQAWVDGEPVETVSVFGGLTAVPLAEGEHSVELRYVPQGLKLGIVISALALLCCAVVELGARRIVIRCKKKSG